jgi:hypothetical protein
MYSADVSDYPAYREALKQVFDEFETYIRPIGTEPISWGVRTGSGLRKSRGAWIRWAGHKRLALVENERADGLMGAISGWGATKFVDWVPQDLSAFVIAKTQREIGPLETIDHPSGEKSIYDLQQIVRQGIAEEERKRETDKAKGEHDEQMRKMAEQFAKDHPDWAP